MSGKYTQMNRNNRYNNNNNNGNSGNSNGTNKYRNDDSNKGTCLSFLSNYYNGN